MENNHSLNILNCYFHFFILYYEGHMTSRTDHNHLTSRKVLLACFAKSLPTSTAFQLDLVTQLVHQDCVLIDLEKDLQTHTICQTSTTTR